MVKIFVEGKEDKLFIQEYLKHLSFNMQISEIEIENAGGWNKIALLDNKFKEISDQNGKNLVIFDADSPKNGGGFQTRMNQLVTLKNKVEIEFELFLFPNHKDDGDFELLLENIINAKHRVLLECFAKYENCIKSSIDENDDFSYTLPIRKAKIYSYVDAFPKSNSQSEKFKNGDYFFWNEEYWNLNSNYLAPLKEFLVDNLGLP